MKNKGCLPRYRCRECGAEFAAKSGYRACRKCKHKPGELPFKCTRLGWDGAVHQLGITSK